MPLKLRRLARQILTFRLNQSRSFQPNPADQIGSNNAAAKGAPMGLVIQHFSGRNLFKQHGFK